MSGVPIIREDEVRAVLDMASCIDAVEAAFVSYSGGSAELPGVIHLDVPESKGEIHVKAGHLHGAPYYAVKVASGFYGTDPAAYDGMVVVFDSRDGSPAAFILDNGFITDQRTGAAGGVAARHLAPQEVGTVAVIGTGLQARYQLDALSVIRPGFSTVRVWGRNPDNAAICIEDLRSRNGLQGCRYEAASSVSAAVEGADVVITCTASRAPLVSLDMLAPGAHVTAVGSDGEGKQELHPAVLAAADILAVDSKDQCARLGELQHAVAGIDSVELGEIAGGHAPGRVSEGQLTVCDLTGVGVQDVAAANLVMSRLGTA